MFLRIEGKGFKGHYTNAFGSLETCSPAETSSCDWPASRGAIHPRKSSAAIGQSDPARRRYSMAVAELKEIQLAEKRGELVSISDVTATLADELTAVRGRLLAMPGRLAGALAIMSDPAEIEAAIDKEVRGALTELSTGS
jgi:hypothetical protein